MGIRPGALWNGGNWEIWVALFSRWVGMLFGSALYVYHAGWAAAFRGAWNDAVFVIWGLHAVAFTWICVARPALWYGRRGPVLVWSAYLFDLSLVTSWLVAGAAEPEEVWLILPFQALVVVLRMPGVRQFLSALALAFAFYGSGLFYSHIRFGMFYREPMFWMHIFFGMAYLVGAHRFNTLRLRQESLLMMQRELEASARELAASNRVLAQLSYSDALTGLYNHRYFYQRLEQELERARSTGRPVALLMLDIDYFKLYNDTQGHTKGDSVLQEVAQLLRENSRESDVICRYGGEEFAVILPGAGEEEAVGVAERVRRAVAGHAFEGGDGQPGGRLTVSIGVAVCPDQAAESGELVERADQALYLAKHSGKNNVKVYSAVRSDDGAQCAGEGGSVRAVLHCLEFAKSLQGRFLPGHAEQVAAYAAATAERLGLDPVEVWKVRIAGWVHDLELLDDRATFPAGRDLLTDAERRVIRYNTLIGLGVISPPGVLEDVSAIIRHQEERWDGSGPSGLAGEAIPVGSRILAAVNHYSHLRRQSPYRRAMSAAEALAELQAEAGRRFDPAVVEALAGVLAEAGELPRLRADLPEGC